MHVHCVPAVYGLTVVRVEGVAVTEVELLHVAALELVYSPPWAVLVTKPAPDTAGANSHLTWLPSHFSSVSQSDDPTQ